MRVTTVVIPEGEETLEDFNRVPRVGDRHRVIVDRNVSHRRYGERRSYQELGGNVNKIIEEHKEKEEQTAARDISGLNPSIQEKLSLMPICEPGHRSNVCPKQPTYYLVESGNEGLVSDDLFQEEDEDLEYTKPLD
ncbi:hypothetical protein Tco_1056744 [Tanacetum coccineum]|uniref:Uncharacterized protein n=1 Tax=Tanacetum coccineum TaxID=301880 RepID=A0ABQ5H5B5_9ASTR